MLAPALAFAAGCANYQLGTGTRLAFATLYVQPMANHALFPQAQAIISTQIRETLEKDGRVVLVNSAEAADATLEVTLTDYRREVAAVREQDTGLASKLAVTLSASCTLRDNRTGRPYFENRALRVTRSVFTDNGSPSSSLVGNQLQAEYNAVPLLAESLASTVAHNIFDVW